MATPDVNVAIAVDNSDHAIRAFEWYADNAHKAGNHVILLHVPQIYDIAAHNSMTFSANAWQEMLQRSQAEVKHLQKKFEALLKTHKMGGKWLTIQHGGQAGEGIVKVAKDEKATMIVIGTRGQGTMRRTILGSVSDYVLHHAHCPVVVCRESTGAK